MILHVGQIISCPVGKPILPTNLDVRIPILGLKNYHATEEPQRMRTWRCRRTNISHAFCDLMDWYQPLLGGVCDSCGMPGVVPPVGGKATISRVVVVNFIVESPFQAHRDHLEFVLSVR